MLRATSSGDDKLDREVWAQTAEEVSAGWLKGPLTESQVTADLGTHWIANRRFGLRQAAKIRCIDDCAESQANTSLTITEKLD